MARCMPAAWPKAGSGGGWRCRGRGGMDRARRGWHPLDLRRTGRRGQGPVVGLLERCFRMGHSRPRATPPAARSRHSTWRPGNSRPVRRSPARRRPATTSRSQPTVPSMSPMSSARAFSSSSPNGMASTCGRPTSASRRPRTRVAWTDSRSATTVPSISTPSARARLSRWRWRRTGRPGRSPSSSPRGR